MGDVIMTGEEFKEIQREIQQLNQANIINRILFSEYERILLEMNPEYQREIDLREGHEQLEYEHKQSIEGGNTAA